MRITGSHMMHNIMLNKALHVHTGTPVHSSLELFSGQNACQLCVCIAQEARIALSQLQIAEIQVRPNMSH